MTIQFRTSRFSLIDFDHNSDGSTTVAVHQVVIDAKTGALLADEHVAHRYWAEDGLIVRMNVVEPSG